MTDFGTERRTAEQVEHELEESRSQINRTIAAIQDRISPGQLANDAYGYLSNNGGGDFARNLGTAAKNNPVPVALVALGLAWLMMGRGTPAYLQQSPDSESGTSFGTAGSGSLSDAVVRVGSRLFGFGQAANDTAAGTSERVRQMSDDARNLASEWSEDASGAAESARGQMHRAGDAVQGQAAQVRDSAGRMLQDQPLVAGALGIAIGAVLGALVPLSRRENEVIGEARDELFEQAARHGQRAADVAVQTVEEGSERRAAGSPSGDSARDSSSDGSPRSDQPPGGTQSP